MHVYIFWSIIAHNYLLFIRFWNGDYENYRITVVLSFCSLALHKTCARIMNTKSKYKNTELWKKDNGENKIKYIYNDTKITAIS